jgi:hypothetical protein
MRDVCIICKITYNVEDGINCHQCKYFACQECIIMNDDGCYYCIECCNDNNSND